MEQTVILASASPRRRDLLNMAGVPFQIVVSDIEETLEPGCTPEQAVVQLAPWKEKFSENRKMRETQPVCYADYPESPIKYSQEFVYGFPRKKVSLFLNAQM